MRCATRSTLAGASEGATPGYSKLLRCQMTSNAFDFEGTVLITRFMSKPRGIRPTLRCLEPAKRVPIALHACNTYLHACQRHPALRMLPKSTTSAFDLCGYVEQIILQAGASVIKLRALTALCSLCPRWRLHPTWQELRTVNILQGLGFSGLDWTNLTRGFSMILWASPEFATFT